MNFTRCIFCFLLAVFSFPESQASDSVIVVDGWTGRVLVEKDAGKKRPIASLTKVATALVVLDWAEATGQPLSGLATVPQSALGVGGSNPMGLQPGDQISLRDALYSALLGSDNIAALTLADSVGRSLLQIRKKNGDPVRLFVSEMNALARALKMERTSFRNPHGLDTAKQRGFSSAADVARLCIHAMKKESFAFFVKQEKRKISFQRGGASLDFTVKSTNEILGKEGIIGVKTGTTSFAGPCFAACDEKSPVVEKLADGSKRVTRRRLISVVLGSSSRFEQSEAVLKQGWSIFDQWQAAGFPIGLPGERYLNVPEL